MMLPAERWSKAESEDAGTAVALLNAPQYFGNFAHAVA
jgi:hypothetical protein